LPGHLDRTKFGRIVTVSCVSGDRPVPSHGRAIHSGRHEEQALHELADPFTSQLLDDQLEPDEPFAGIGIRGARPRDGDKRTGSPVGKARRMPEDVTNGDGLKRSVGAKVRRPPVFDEWPIKRQHPFVDQLHRDIGEGGLGHRCRLEPGRFGHPLLRRDVRDAEAAVPREASGNGRRNA